MLGKKVRLIHAQIRYIGHCPLGVELEGCLAGSWNWFAVFVTRKIGMQVRVGEHVFSFRENVSQTNMVSMVMVTSHTTLKGRPHSTSEYFSR